MSGWKSLCYILQLHSLGVVLSFPEQTGKLFGFKTKSNAAAIAEVAAGGSFSVFRFTREKFSISK